jgi:hypothetical protein
MGLKPNEFTSREASEGRLGSWHANLIYIERRKCVLFTNDRTLLNFLVTSASRDQIRELSEMFRRHLQKLLTQEEIDEDVRKDLVQEYREIHYDKSNSRSVLGSMNDLAYHYEVQIAHNGGFQQCSMPFIIKRLNRMPMGSLDYLNPIEVFRKKVWS